MERVKVILNPYSGRGSGARAKERICRALARAGVSFDLTETTGIGHGIELARQARLDGYRTVVAVGGDGTVSEVMNGLAQATPPGELVGKLGLLPLGSGNDFAATAGCAMHLEQAAYAIAAGKTRCVDLEYVTLYAGDQTLHRYFDNSMGVGFVASVTLESNKIKRLSGVLLYGLATLRILNSYRPPYMSVAWETANGETGSLDQKILLVNVGNSPRTGGGFYLTPHARLDNGLLDVAIAKAIPPLRVLFLLPKALLGKHTTDPAVTMLRCRQLLITCPETLPVQLDGEMIAQNAERIEIGIQPGRLEIIV